MISLTQSRALAVGGVYWYESVLNDRSRRVVEKCGLNLQMVKSGKGGHIKLSISVSSRSMTVTSLMTDKCDHPYYM